MQYVVTHHCAYLWTSSSSPQSRTKRRICMRCSHSAPSTTYSCRVAKYKLLLHFSLFTIFPIIRRVQRERSLAHSGRRIFIFIAQYSGAMAVCLHFMSSYINTKIYIYICKVLSSGKRETNSHRTEQAESSACFPYLSACGFGSHKT